MATWLWRPEVSAGPIVAYGRAECRGRGFAGKKKRLELSCVLACAWSRAWTELC